MFELAKRFSISAEFIFCVFVDACSFGELISGHSSAARIYATSSARIFLRCKAIIPRIDQLTGCSSNSRLEKRELRVTLTGGNHLCKTDERKKCLGLKEGMKKVTHGSRYWKNRKRMTEYLSHSRLQKSYGKQDPRDCRKLLIVVTRS